MNEELTFGALRRANTMRLPQFKNAKGKPAHSTADGSDWTPAQWFQALVGEIGEYAEVRTAFDLGWITFEEYHVKAAKELADIQTYLDILARRGLDRTLVSQAPQLDPAQVLQWAMAMIGQYANNRKKVERGDGLVADLTGPLEIAIGVIERLRRAEYGPTNAVSIAHPGGIDLAQATINKFNEVSVRVGSDVTILDDGTVVVVGAGPTQEANAG